MTLDLSCVLPVVSVLVASSVEICIRWSKVMVAVTANITLRPRQNGRHFPDDIYKSIFLNENVWFSIKISLKLVSNDPINNMPALVQIMAWRRPGDKPLSEPMLVCLLTHICVTRPQWDTVYPKKYAHGFVVLCFVVVMQSFIMNIGYGKISQCITTTKHSKAKSVCIFLYDRSCRQLSDDNQ